MFWQKGFYVAVKVFTASLVITFNNTKQDPSHRIKYFFTRCERSLMSCPGHWPVWHIHARSKMPQSRSTKDYSDYCQVIFPCLFVCLLLNGTSALIFPWTGFETTVCASTRDHQHNCALSTSRGISTSYGKGFECCAVRTIQHNTLQSVCLFVC